ncbi:hypothetical protein RQP46_010721 [Phenoliferia psychrophenolica]
MLIHTQPHASTSTAVYTSPKVLIVNGKATVPASLELSGGRVKKFVCSVDGCGKAYTRPVRLEEHRPFKCPSCPSTFARDSHLKAHVRTHADATSAAEAKKYVCDRAGCDKKFWTGQHLRKHIEVVHEGKTYDCEECQLEFRKHHLLRTHIAEVHSTPGTKPFPCPEPACDKSFTHGFQLKAHAKTHDTSRYLCAHPACTVLPLPSRQFSNWSALQKHTKSVHPPTCPHPECEGKTFTTARGLKWHLEVHDRKEGDEGARGSSKRRRIAAEDETEEEDCSDESADDDEDPSTPFACTTGRCSRRFKSAGALANHTTLKHSAIPPTPSSRPKRAATSRTPKPKPKLAEPSLLDLLTGSNYDDNRKYPCPYPDIQSISHPLEDDDLSDAEGPQGEEGVACDYRFKRVYDVERHLRSFHHLEAHRDELREWFEGEE